MSLVDELMLAIAPVVEGAGGVLEEITITPAGKRRILAVIVDGKTENLSLDQVTVISKAVSEIVDGLDVLGSMAFTLEVTSPGIDRPLTLPRHWRKNISRLVKITMADKTKKSGRIKEVSDTAVTVTMSRSSKEKASEEVIEFDLIKRAQIEIEFNRKDSGS